MYSSKTPYPKRPPVGRIRSMPAHACFFECQIPLTEVESSLEALTSMACSETTFCHQTNPHQKIAGRWQDTHQHTHTHTHTHTQTHTYMHTCKHAHQHTHTHTNTHTNTCTHAHMHTRTHTQASTHTHTQVASRRFAAVSRETRRPVLYIPVGILPEDGAGRNPSR